jgi:hypothetical protein
MEDSRNTSIENFSNEAIDGTKIQGGDVPTMSGDVIGTVVSDPIDPIVKPPMSGDPIDPNLILPPTDPSKLPIPGDEVLGTDSGPVIYTA